MKLSLDPTKGHEQAGYRPVIVISNDKYNEVCGGMIKVLPITSNDKNFPLHVSLPEDLPVYGKVELDHERSIDSSSRQYTVLGKIPNEFLQELISMTKATY